MVIYSVVVRIKSCLGLDKKVLVLVLRPRVLVLVLTKKSYLHHWLMYNNKTMYRQLVSVVVDSSLVVIEGVIWWLYRILALKTI